MAGPYILTIGVTIILVCLVAGQENGIGKEEPMKDIHGGVKMGVIDPNCDDGQTNINIDYINSINSRPVLKRVCHCQDLRKTRRNRGRVFQQTLQESEGPVVAQEECEPLQDPIHKCLDEAITYDTDVPTSGAHRPLWPKFGEYLYLPKQRWIHSLEHGAIVFLYQPCADQKQVDRLRTVARHCLNKHIITPFEGLPDEYPFAVLSWGCKLLLPSVDKAKIKDFMIRKALQAPETHVADEGQFDVGLLDPMGLDTYEVVDEPICPSEPKSIPQTLQQRTGAHKEMCKDMKKLLGRQRPTGPPRKGGRDKGRNRKKPERGNQDWKDMKEKVMRRGNKRGGRVRKNRWN